MVLWFMMIATMLLLLQPSLSSSAELEVMATMTPESFSVDSGARLTVTVNGSRSADLELPETDPAKYEIFQRGRSSQINIVNGDISAAITFTCIVRAYTPGHYTLPPIIVSADGQSRQTAPLPFTVTGSQPPPQSGAGAGPGKGVEPPSQKSRNSEEIAFLTLELDREDGYVGEIIPVTVKAYFRKGLRAQLNAAPTLVGDGGLIMPQLNEKPVQTEENAGKTRYAVLT